MFGIDLVNTIPNLSFLLLHLANLKNCVILSDDKFKPANVVSRLNRAFRANAGNGNESNESYTKFVVRLAYPFTACTRKCRYFRVFLHSLCWLLDAWYRFIDSEIDVHYGRTPLETDTDTRVYECMIDDDGLIYA